MKKRSAARNPPSDERTPAVRRLPAAAAEQPGQTADPDPLGRVIAELFARRGYGRVQADSELRMAWEQVAGPELAAQARMLNLRSGTVHIRVANAALRSELAAFRRPELLQQLQQLVPHLKIKDLKFKS